MICQGCGNKEATTHIKTVVNGVLTQYHLCEECAREKGYGNLFGNWSFGFENMLGGLMGTGAKTAVPSHDVPRCPKCGCSFEEISESGKLGCADCYRTFRSRLIPVLQRIHGTARHKGKVPGGSALRLTDANTKIMPVTESPLEEKQRLLKAAVAEQDFETAAILRDEIKEMKGNA